MPDSHGLSQSYYGSKMYDACFEQQQILRKKKKGAVIN